jgi:hypothetical protein
METMAKRQKNSEEYCYSCERLLLLATEKLGPVCLGCFQKTKRRDKLMRAAVAQVVVAVLPMVCPHDGKGHLCRTRFQVIILDKNLEPKNITGPYSLRAAERHAASVRKNLGNSK